MYTGSIPVCLHKKKGRVNLEISVLTFKECAAVHLCRWHLRDKTHVLLLVLTRLGLPQFFLQRAQVVSHKNCMRMIRLK